MGWVIQATNATWLLTEPRKRFFRKQEIVSFEDETFYYQPRLKNCNYWIVYSVDFILNFPQQSFSIFILLSSRRRLKFQKKIRASRLSLSFMTFRSSVVYSSTSEFEFRSSGWNFYQRERERESSFVFKWK